MTTQKDFKRLVRGRMQKTGESFTTARASLLKQGPTRGEDTEGNGHAPSAVATVAPRRNPPSPTTRVLAG